MKKGSLLLAVILVVMICLSACGGSVKTEANDMMATTGEAEKPETSMDYADGLKAESSESGTGSDIYANEDNKVIRTANLTIQTTEFDTAVEALNKLTSEQGGWFEKAEVESGGYYSKYANRSAYYVVRVPKENFAAFRDGTAGIGHIYSISENSQDVGETYYDTEARLTALTTKRDRLLALLEKAEAMEDIITLENALADVQYEIDAHTATLRKYDSLIGYSTFYIWLDEVTEITNEPSAKEPFSSRFTASLKAGFKDFSAGMQDFVLWLARNLIGVVVFAAAVAAVLLTGRRLIRRRRARSRDAE